MPISFTASIASLTRCVIAVRTLHAHVLWLAYLFLLLLIFLPSWQGGEVLDVFEYSWTKAANMVFMEQPLFVGYSISGDKEADGKTNDEINAKRLVQFLANWYAKFPEFASNDMSLSSESYGGHYLPVTATKLLEHSARRLAAGDSLRRSPGAGGPFGNFRGFLVGNPYTNLAENNKGMMHAVWGHGLLPSTAYEEWRKICDGGNSVDDGTDDVSSITSPARKIMK